MTRSLSVTIVLALACTHGCSSTTLRAFQGWTISSVPTPRPPHRSLETGHLLSSGDGLVLAVDHFSPGNIIAIDDEQCRLLLVEVRPGELDGLPRTVEHPRAYLRNWACTWMRVEEETPSQGRVEVLRREGDSIEAQLDFRFPSRRVRKRGWFRISNPDRWLVRESHDEDHRP